jgi:hypothetical protein
MVRRLLILASAFVLSFLVFIPLLAVPLGGTADSELDIGSERPIRIIACPSDGSFKVVGEYLTVEVNIEKEDETYAADKCRKREARLHTRVARKLSRKLGDALSVPVKYLTRVKVVLQVMGRLAIRVVRYMFD